MVKYNIIVSITEYFNSKERYTNILINTEFLFLFSYWNGDGELNSLFHFILQRFKIE